MNTNCNHYNPQDYLLLLSHQSYFPHFLIHLTPAYEKKPGDPIWERRMDLSTLATRPCTALATPYYSAPAAHARESLMKDDREFEK